MGREPQRPGLAAGPVQGAIVRHAGDQEKEIQLATATRPMSRRRLLLASLGLALAGCARERAGTGSDSQQASCAPGGPDLRVTARSLRCDTDCLAAPAGQPFTIIMDNRDAGIPHNVAVDTDPRMSETLFKGRLVDGKATITDRVPARPASTYDFRCDVHPSAMNGTFIVG
jgi:plastocyanin